MKIKGIRDIPTVQGLAYRAVPATRAQVVTHLARAEHEKARLERELGMLAASREKSERRLRQVTERIALLQQALHGDSRTGTGRSAKRRRAARSRGHVTSDPPRWRAIPLEY